MQVRKKGNKRHKEWTRSELFSLKKPAKNQDLLGTMPVLLVLMFLPFFQTVCFDKQRIAPE